MKSWMLLAVLLMAASLPVFAQKTGDATGLVARVREVAKASPGAYEQLLPQVAATAVSLCKGRDWAANREWRAEVEG